MGLSRRGLSARFDTRVLRPPAVAADEVARLRGQPACAAALQAWCQGGGPALAVAALHGTSASDLAAWADALARRLDGGTRLDALGRAAGLAWRLRIKLAEAWPGRHRRPDVPWDVGWALASSDALAHWQTRWQPRRATLILADGRQADTLQAALQALSARCDGFHQPVRWLWVGGEGALPPMPGQALARFRLV